MPAGPVFLRVLARRYITSLENIEFQRFIVLAFGTSAKMLISEDMLLSTSCSRQASQTCLPHSTFPRSVLIVDTAGAFPYPLLNVGETGTSSSHHCVGCQECTQTLPHMDCSVFSPGLKFSDCSWNTGYSLVQMYAPTVKWGYLDQWVFSGSLFCIVQAPLKRLGICLLLISHQLLVSSQSGLNSVCSHSVQQIPVSHFCVLSATWLVICLGSWYQARNPHRKFASKVGVAPQGSCLHVGPGFSSPVDRAV